MFAPLKRGQIVSGAIASISDSEILIDVGAKSEGIIKGRELERLDREVLAGLEVGEDIEVYVLNPEDRQGHILLSLSRALEEQDWTLAEEYMQDETVYESKVSHYNKGGLIVRFGRVRGFVPASQVSRDRRRRSTGNTPEDRWASMVGEEISVKVIEVDRGRNRLILSERAAAREKRAEKRAELLDSLTVGQVLTGHVISLADFGAFVDLGGADGLIHLSELSYRHVDHPRDVLKVGEEVEVEIIHIDVDRQRIGLSRKSRLEDPWDRLAREYEPDQLVQGRVTKLTKFGAFARLVDAPEIEGLIHISELADRRVEHPSEIVSEGEVLTLRILRIDTDRRRVGLSLKRVDSSEYLSSDWREMLDSVNMDADEDDDEDEDVVDVEDYDDLDDDEDADEDEDEADED
jgi:small subunit ribosomal protein S1